MCNGKFLLPTFFFTLILTQICQFEVEIIRSYVVFEVVHYFIRNLSCRGKDVNVDVNFKLIYFITQLILGMEVCGF